MTSAYVFSLRVPQAIKNMLKRERVLNYETEKMIFIRVSEYFPPIVLLGRPLGLSFADASYLRQTNWTRQLSRASPDGPWLTARDSPVIAVPGHRLPAPPPSWTRSSRTALGPPPPQGGLGGRWCCRWSRRRVGTVAATTHTRTRWWG